MLPSLEKHDNILIAVDIVSEQILERYWYAFNGTPLNQTNVFNNQ